MDVNGEISDRWSAHFCSTAAQIYLFSKYFCACTNIFAQRGKYISPLNPNANVAEMSRFLLSPLQNNNLGRQIVTIGTTLAGKWKRALLPTNCVVAMATVIEQWL